MFRFFSFSTDPHFFVALNKNLAIYIYCQFIAKQTGLGGRNFWNLQGLCVSAQFAKRLYPSSKTFLGHARELFLFERNVQKYFSSNFVPFHVCKHR